MEANNTIFSITHNGVSIQIETNGPLDHALFNSVFNSLTSKATEKLKEEMKPAVTPPKRGRGRPRKNKV